MPTLLQEAALGLLSSPAWPRHLKRLRSHLGERRDALVAQLRAHESLFRVNHVPSGGIHLWVRLPDGADPSTLTVRSHGAGVLIGDGSHYFVDEPPAPYIRLSYSAASVPQISEGVRRLAILLG